MLVLLFALYSVFLLFTSTNSFCPSRSARRIPQEKFILKRESLVIRGILPSRKTQQGLPTCEAGRASPICFNAKGKDYEDAEIEEDNSFDEAPNQPISVTIDTELSDDKLKQLFAWVKCAFDFDENSNDVYGYYYNNMELAIAAVFGNNLPKDSLPATLLARAIKSEGLDKRSLGRCDGDKEWEERLIGDPISRRDRESASLGAMGAAQWTGRWMTRPHCEF